MSMEERAHPPVIPDVATLPVSLASSSGVLINSSRVCTALSVARICLVTFDDALPQHCSTSWPVKTNF